MLCFFFFSSRRRHTSSTRDWSSDVCSSDLRRRAARARAPRPLSSRAHRAGPVGGGARRVRRGGGGAVRRGHRPLRRARHEEVGMKAVVFAGKGGPEVIEVRELPDPRPARGEVLVRVRAAALNRADLLQRRGLYPPPAGLREDVPGLELAGEVVRPGEGVTAFRPGDRVMAIAGGEGQAELAVVHERMLLPVPEGLSLEDAAALPEAGITAHDALFT